METFQPPHSQHPKSRHKNSGFGGIARKGTTVIELRTELNGLLASDFNPASVVSPASVLPKCSSFQDETSTLGAMLMDGFAIEWAQEIVTKEDFYNPDNANVFDVITHLHNERRPIDIQTVRAEIERRGWVEEMGGAAYIPTYLTSLIEACPSTKNVRAYAREVRRLADDRRLVVAAKVFLQDARNLNIGPAQAAQQLIARINAINQRATCGSDFVFSTDEALDELLGNIEWLWPGWILRGFVTTIVAPQEAGKSHFCLDLCTRLILKWAWPDGASNSTSCDKILWVDTEMTLAGFRQRIVDANLPRGHFILPPDPLMVLSLDNPNHIEWIENAIKKFNPPVMFVDALAGAHRGEEKSNDHMKLVMMQLSQLAQKHKIAVVVVHHLRKANEVEPTWPINLDRVRGASAITQYSRVVIALGAPDPTQPDARRAEVIKSNFGPKPKALGYRIGSQGMEWGQAPEPPRSRRPRDLAREFLLDYLQEGPCPSDDVLSAAEEQSVCGIGTLRSTFKEMGGRSCKRRVDGQDHWFMELPPHLTPKMTRNQDDGVIGEDNASS